MHPVKPVKLMLFKKLCKYFISYFVFFYCVKTSYL